MDKTKFIGFMEKLNPELGIRMLALAQDSDLGKRLYFPQRQEEPELSDCTGTVLWVWNLFGRARPCSFGTENMRILLESPLFEEVKMPGSVLAIQCNNGAKHDHYCIYIGSEKAEEESNRESYFVFEQHNKGGPFRFHWINPHRTQYKKHGYNFRFYYPAEGRLEEMRKKLAKKETIIL